MKFTGDEKQLYITVFTTGLSIVIYWIVLAKIYDNSQIHYRDVLNKQVIDIPWLGKNCCSWWPLSHLLSFALWGFLWPRHGWKLFVIGILWEIVEFIGGYFQKKTAKHHTTNVNGKLEYENWWSASNKDIVFNGAGILIGIYLKKCLSK